MTKRKGRFLRDLSCFFAVLFLVVIKVERLLALDLPAMKGIQGTHNSISTFKNFGKKEITIYSLDASFPYEILNQDKLLTFINSLPENIQKSPVLNVSCDKNGIFWAINAVGLRIVYDSDHNRVIYEAKADEGTLFISPEGKYLITYYPASEKCEDCELDFGLKKLPGLESVINPSNHLKFIHLIGQNERLAFVSESKSKQTGIVDLSSSSPAMIPMSDDKVPDPYMSFEMPDGDHLLGVPHHGKVVTLWNISDMSVESTFSNLAPGPCFSTPDGNVIGTYNSNLVSFYNLTTKEEKSFCLSQNNNDLLLELNRLHGIPVTVTHKSDDSREVLKTNPWDISSSAYVSGKPTPQPSTQDDPKRKSMMEHVLPGFNQANLRIRIEHVFSGQDGLWIDFNRYKRGVKKHEGDAIVVHLGNDLKIDKVFRFNWPFSKLARFDSQKLHLVDFDFDSKRDKFEANIQ